MARAVLDFATPIRALLIVVVAGGLLGAVVFDHPVLQVGGVAFATLAIVALLAQLSRRVDRAGSGTISRAASPVGAMNPVRRTISRSPTIVSVVIPGKNEAAYARDCIRSLKAQTLTNFDAILIDDGSTDSTLDVLLDEIGDDPRFRIIRTPRSVGIGRARNLGVARSTARYITFLDLDDFLAPDALASRVELAEQHADMPWVAGSYCWHEMVDPDATPERWLPPTTGRRGTISWMSHIDDNVVIVTTPLLRRDAFLAVGGFDGVPTAEDFDVLVQDAALGLHPRRHRNGERRLSSETELPRGLHRRPDAGHGGQASRRTNRGDLAAREPERPVLLRGHGGAIPLGPGIYAKNGVCSWDGSGGRKPKLGDRWPGR